MEEIYCLSQVHQSLGNLGYLDLTQGNSKVHLKDEIMKVLFRFYDKNLFEQDLAKSMTAGFTINNKDNKAKLRIWLDKYRIREYKETPLLDNFNEICKIVADQYENDEFKAQLLIIYDVLMRKEQERKPPHYIHTSQFRDGLDVQAFFFDLINHIAGYTEKYYEEHIDKISHDELLQKYRQEKKKFENKDLKESHLLGDRYPHCLMVLEGIQEIARMKHAEKYALNYLDNLILRLLPANDKWYRNHFPVIMETNMSKYFNEDIYNQLNIAEFQLPTLEFFGYFEEIKKLYLSGIYNSDQLKLLEDKIGRSIYFWNIFTELLKARKENETFEQFLDLKDEAFQKIRNEFFYRVNKLYTHPMLGDLLDSGEIDYAILDVLEQWWERRDVLVHLNRQYGREEFMYYPVIRALLDLNIIYKAKYFEYIFIENQLYAQFMREFVREKKAHMNQYEKIRYKLYRKVHGIKFGSWFSGVSPARSLYIGGKPLRHEKAGYHYGGLDNLYYKTGDPNVAETKSLF